MCGAVSLILRVLKGLYTDTVAFPLFYWIYHLFRCSNDHLLNYFVCWLFSQIRGLYSIASLRCCLSWWQ